MDQVLLALLPDVPFCDSKRDTFFLEAETFCVHFSVQSKYAKLLRLAGGATSVSVLRWWVVPLSVLEWRWWSGLACDPCSHFISLEWRTLFNNKAPEAGRSTDGDTRTRKNTLEFSHPLFISYRISAWLCFGKLFPETGRRACRRIHQAHENILFFALQNSRSIFLYST